ncbi:MAG TPA: rod shape-determining protein MreD [Polyangiaceae bacterium]|jgi:rod shape-determining protein MreD|nr:rod shape-determining protein MreD [Polyangiaceae bacterium]
MKSLGFYAVATLLILVQSNLYRLFGPLAGLVGAHWLHGATPSLALPLVIFLGVHEPSMPRGAGLAFVIGYTLDLLAAAPVGLFTFVYVLIWWLSRVAGVRLTAQTVLTRVSLAFIFALVESAVILVLLAVFGSDNKRPLELTTIVLPHAISTALCAPLLFRLAQRLRQGAASARAQHEAVA